MLCKSFKSAISIQEEEGARYLLPEWRPCRESMQLKLVTFKVEQGQVETLNLDQHLQIRQPVKKLAFLAIFTIPNHNKHVSMS